MSLHSEYAVTYRDFCVSLRQYRRRSKLSAFVYYLDVWILPIAGAAVVATYCFGLLTHSQDIIYALGWLALIGLLMAVVLPTLYQLRLRQTYKQRTVLAEGGNVTMEKAEVRYEWNAFSDYSEERDVITLFVDNSAFHTIPTQGLSTEERTTLKQLISNHVRKI